MNLYEGKMKRGGYIGRTIVVFIIGVVAYLALMGTMFYNMASITEVSPTSIAGAGMPIILSILLGIAITIYTLGITTQRLRDLNHNPWFCLLYFIPYVNFAMWVYLCLAPSKPPISTNL